MPPPPPSSVGYSPYACVDKACFGLSALLFVKASTHDCDKSFLFAAVFVNVTQDSQIEGAIVSTGGQPECIRQLDSSH